MLAHGMWGKSVMLAIATTRKLNHLEWLASPHKAIRKVSNPLALTKLCTRLLYLSLIAFTLSIYNSAQALKMDESTHDEVIRRLEMGVDSMDKAAPERSGILLRLAGLYSDRARLKAINEMDTDCSKCTGARDDRKRAIALFEEALPRTDKTKQGDIVLLIAHLHTLNEQTSKSKQLYEKILNGRRGTYSSEVRALAHANLGEIEFRKGRFRQALKHYQNAEKEKLKTRALVTYRMAWCHFNLGRTESAIGSLADLLSNPQKLATQTTDGKNVDPAFVRDASADLARFTARGKITSSRIQHVVNLSPDETRRDNLKTLATEADRLGRKREALQVWGVYADQGENSKTERIEILARVAKIHYDLGQADQAVTAYEKALETWRQSGCQGDTCDELKTSLRKFVTSWNRALKIKPTAQVLRAYNAFLITFTDDLEMTHWAAVVAHDVGQHKKAHELFAKAAKVAHEGLKKNPNDKKIKSIFEGSLLGAVEMAEASNDNTAKEAAYDQYLNLNPEGEKAFEIRYQRARLYAQTGRHERAHSEFHALAMQPGIKNRHIKIQAADLSLDSLVAMKDDQALKTRSMEYAEAFPQRREEYSKISRKATLNLVAANTNGKNLTESAYKKNLSLLADTPLAGASKEEKIELYKNKIIVAQKAMDVNATESACIELMAIRGLKDDDREWAMAQQVWAAELQLDFAKAYHLSKKMKLKHLSKADRELRLGMLADLADFDSRKHNLEFIKLTNNLRAANNVRVTLIRKSPRPWRELNTHLSKLRRNPDLLASIALESFARDRQFSQARKIIAIRDVTSTADGQALRRQIELGHYRDFDQKIARHRVSGANDALLQKTLKARLKLVAEAERKLQGYIRMRDWTLQTLALATLARENQRLYADIKDLPVPRRLKGLDRERYRALLAQQSRPYAEKAQALGNELNRRWQKSDSLDALQTAYMNSSTDMRNILKVEISALKNTAPGSTQSRLDRVLRTPSQHPSQKEILTAKRALKEDPFDVRKAEHLRQLAARSGAMPMVAYLDERIHQLKKGATL